MKQKQKGKKGPLRAALNWVGCILVILVVAFVLLRFVGQSIQVTGEAMQPTLKNGDQLIIDKITYAFSEPRRFDVIVFPSPYRMDTYYFRRIIGLPGETVQIANGEIFINGQAVAESFPVEEGPFESGLASMPLTLEEGEYFVLGDNRADSTDSRNSSIGNIQESSIIGRAVLRIWPPNRLGLIH